MSTRCITIQINVAYQQTIVNYYENLARLAGNLQNWFGQRHWCEYTGAKDFSVLKDCANISKKLESKKLNHHGQTDIKKITKL